MQRIYLPKHVFFCGQGDALIFLDLKHDEYTMLYGQEANTFRSLCECGSGTGAQGKDAPVDVEDFIAAGLITTDETNGKPIAPSALSPPLTALSDTRSACGRVKVSYIFSFFVACITASIRLRRQSIQAIVSGVERRRRERLTPNPHADVRALVTAFHRLRHFYPRSYLCLFDSLALLEFLARYNFFPRWIFAVKFDPWVAHCWVQQGDMCLNQEVEDASDYVPIMSA